MASAIKEQTYEFKLIGDIDLLMHRDDVELSDELMEFRKAMKREESVKGDDRSPPWSWMTYVYHDGQHVCCPCENVMAALKNGGAKVIIKGNKSFKEVSQSGIRPLSPFFDLRVGGKQIKFTDIMAMREKSFREQKAAAEKLGFTLFVKRAPIKPGGPKHVRVRPRLSGWTVTGRVRVTSNLLTDDTLKQIFDHAGQAGLMDWRPSSKTPGVFGVFRSELKKVG